MLAVVTSFDNNSESSRRGFHSKPQRTLNCRRATPTYIPLTTRRDLSGCWCYGRCWWCHRQLNCCNISPIYGGELLHLCNTVSIDVFYYSLSRHKEKVTKEKSRQTRSLRAFCLACPLSLLSLQEAFSSCGFFCRCCVFWPTTEALLVLAEAPDTICATRFKFACSTTFLALNF